MDRRGRWCLDLSLHLNIILSEFCSNLVVISLYLADLREEQKFKHFAVMEKFDSDKQIVKMLPNLKQSQNPWVATLFGKKPWNYHLSHVLCVEKWKCHKVEYSKLSLIWLMIWHMTWRLGQSALNYKIINLPNIKTYKYTHLTKCLPSAFCFHNYSVKPSIKFLFTKYRVNKFINQWQTHRFTWTSITFHPNILLLDHEGY